MSEFLETLRESIAYVCETGLDQVQPETTLEALGIDSVKVSQLIVETEFRTGMEVDVEVLERLRADMTINEIAGELLKGASAP